MTSQQAITLVAAVITTAALFAGQLLLRRHLLGSIPELRFIEACDDRSWLYGSILSSYEPPGVQKLLLYFFAYGSVLLLPELCAWGGIRPLWELLVIVCVMPPIMTARYWLCRSSLQRFVRRKLAERGFLVCLHCGYDLRGQEVPRCPECGKAFDPRRFSIRSGAFYCVDSWPPKKSDNKKPVS